MGDTPVAPELVLSTVTSTPAGGTRLLPLSWLCQPLNLLPNGSHDCISLNTFSNILRNSYGRIHTGSATTPQNRTRGGTSWPKGRVHCQSSFVCLTVTLVRCMLVITDSGSPTNPPGDLRTHDTLVRCMLVITDSGSPTN